MAQRREPAQQVFAREVSKAIETHVEDREYSPTYLISEVGGKLSRVLVGGILTDIENRGTEEDPFYLARINDPSGGTYHLSAGQYNPEGAAMLSSLEAPCHVMVVGKVRARTPEESNTTYVSLQPEAIRKVDENDVNLWALRACRALHRRVGALRELPHDADPEAAGEHPALAELSPREREGILLSRERYGDMVSPESYGELLYEALATLSGEKPPAFTGDFATAADISDGASKPAPAPTTGAPATAAAPGAATAAPTGEAEGGAEREQRVLDLVGRHDEGVEGAGYETLVEAAKAAGFDSAELDELLDSLSEQGLVYQPAFNRFRVA